MFAAKLGLGSLGCFAWIALCLVLNALLVALVWNVCDLHSVFHAGTLTFVQCFAVGCIAALFGI